MSEDPGETDDTREDPDYISQDGSDHPKPEPASLGFGVPGLSGRPTPLFEPKESTPLDERESTGVVPAFALWAMKYRRHLHLLNRADVAIRECYGSGNETIYVIDDGWKHCMVSRMVGTSPDGCTYCLVAQIGIDSYQALVEGETPTGSIFDDAREACVCAVFEAQDSVSNVSLVEAYRHISDVPSEYLPPHPIIEFSDILDGDV